MTGSPYRTPAAPSEPRPERRDPPTDVDLVPILLLLWVTGVARLVSALIYDEPMRFEPTLALVVAAGVPCLLKTWVGALLRSAVQRLRRSAHGASAARPVGGRRP